MDHAVYDPSRTALLICDLQNDFLHPEGAYARGGVYSKLLTPLPARVRPVSDLVRRTGGMTIGTRFTLVPGRGGHPLVSDHLRALRPFLGKGDFAPGSWGSAIVDSLQPLEAEIEKIAFSAFYMSRLEWLLRQCSIERLLVAGIVTSGGVASTVRDAHVRGFDVTILEDACGDFTSEEHLVAIAALRKVATVTNTATLLLDAKDACADALLSKT